MAVWNNDDLVLYHGCTEQSLLGTNPNGIAVGTLPHRISLTAGGRRTEFGRGFYATSRIDQAKNWAHLQARKLAAKTLSKTTPNAVVLRFDVSRNKLADLEALVFTNENCGFWPFVAYCRSGSVPHGRSTGRQMEYDIVYGPVSIWPQRLVIKDCDQVSFHTVTALNVIPALSVAITGNPYF